MRDVDELICKTYDYIYTKYPGLLHYTKARHKNAFVTRAFFSFFFFYYVLFPADGSGG